MSTPDTKRCTRCYEVKDINEFDHFSSSVDNRHPYCKDCVKRMVELSEKYKKKSIMPEVLYAIYLSFKIVFQMAIEITVVTVLMLPFVLATAVFYGTVALLSTIGKIVIAAAESYSEGLGESFDEKVNDAVKSLMKKYPIK